MSEGLRETPLEPNSFTMMTISDKNGSPLINMGRHHIVGPYTADIHVHPQLEISYVLNGKCLYHIGEQMYNICPGDVFLLGGPRRSLYVIQ